MMGAWRKEVVTGLGGVTLMGAVLFTALGHAQPVYRDGVPDVLQPSAAGGEATITRFRMAYEARQHPRVIVFWNRMLSDQITADRRADLRITDNRVFGARAVQDPGGDPNGWPSASERQGGGSRSIDMSIGERVTAPLPRPGLAESQDWGVESAFVETFLEAGTHLVDRNAAMQLIAASRKHQDAEPREQPDAQEIETAALVDKADLLMEVLQTPDPTGPLGFRFRVNMKETRTGRIVASVMWPTEPLQEMPGEWVAGPNGFEKVVRETTLRTIGRQLADETMQALMTGWGGSAKPAGRIPRHGLPSDRPEIFWSEGSRGSAS